VVEWSPELVTLYGLDRAPTTEDGFLACVHPDDRLRVEAETTGFLAAGDSYQHEFRIVRPGGDVRVIHDRGVIERAENGSVPAVAARLAARRALQKNLQNFNNVRNKLHTSGIGIASCRNPSRKTSRHGPTA
jgi:PAS domain-containing protein